MFHTAQPSLILPSGTSGTRKREWWGAIIRKNHLKTDEKSWSFDYLPKVCTWYSLKITRIVFIIIPTMHLNCYYHAVSMYIIVQDISNKQTFTLAT